jgi:hypothetical protein
MADGYAWLDLSRFGMVDVRRTDGCEKKSNTQWVCSWNQVEIGSPDGYQGEAWLVHTLHNGEGGMINGVSDDFNNLVDLTGENNRGVFLVDASPPSVINYSVTSMGSHDYNYTISGDFLEVVVDVLDYSNVRAYADLSDFVSDLGVVEGDCSFVEEIPNRQNHIRCTWNPIRPIDAEATEEAMITLNFTDLAGYTTNLTIDGLTILEFSNQSGDLWEIGDINVMPDNVDREVVTLIETEVYVSVPFKGNAQMLELSFAGCEGQDTKENNSNAMDYISESTAINTEYLADPNPFILLKLKTMEIEEESLSFTCTFDSVSKNGL